MIPFMVVSVTPAQAEIAKWAIEPMAEYSESPDAGFQEKDIPSVQKKAGSRVLVFPSSLAVGDFLYRIEEQLPDMASHSDDEGRQPGSTNSHVAAARRLGEKIRALTPGVRWITGGNTVEEEAS